MPRAIWVLVIGMAINVTGSSFLWPLNTIYIHEHLGKSLSVAGFVLMLNSGASVVGNLLGGYLFDKLGGYKSILIGITFTLLTLLGLVQFHSWPAYPILLTILGVGTGIVFPAMYAMAGSAWPDGGRRPFNAIYVAQNIGVAVGSALGGLVAGYSFESIFLANTLFYIVFFVITVVGLKGLEAKRVKVVKEKITTKTAGERASFRALMILCVGYMLGWLAYCQWPATIATHTQSFGIDLKQYSLLWTINGGIIVIGQPLISYAVRRFFSTNKQQIIVGFMIFIVSFLVLLIADSFLMFALAMTILTIGEMLVWPAVPTVAGELAPEGRDGTYQGIVNSAATGGRMLGPLIGGIVVDLKDIYLLFTILIGVLILAIAFTVVYDRRRIGERNVTASPPLS